MEKGKEGEGKKDRSHWSRGGEQDLSPPLGEEGSLEPWGEEESQPIRFIDGGKAKAPAYIEP